MTPGDKKNGQRRHSLVIITWGLEDAQLRHILIRLIILQQLLNTCCGFIAFAGEVAPLFALRVECADRNHPAQSACREIVVNIFISGQTEHFPVASSFDSFRIILIS